MRPKKHSQTVFVCSILNYCFRSLQVSPFHLIEFRQWTTIELWRLRDLNWRPVFFLVFWSASGFLELIRSSTDLSYSVLLSFYILLLFWFTQSERSETSETELTILNCHISYGHCPTNVRPDSTVLDVLCIILTRIALWLDIVSAELCLSQEAFFKTFSSNSSKVDTSKCFQLDPTSLAGCSIC